MTIFQTIVRRHKKLRHRRLRVMRQNKTPVSKDLYRWATRKTGAYRNKWSKSHIYG